MAVPLYGRFLFAFILEIILQESASVTINAVFEGTCLSGHLCRQECVDSKDGGHICMCRPGFKINKDGISCSNLTTSNCEGVECYNGTCKMVDSKPTCYCTRRYYGNVCQHARVCDVLDCKNNGTCVLVKSRAKCLCRLGFEGKFCEKVSMDIKYPRFVGSSYYMMPTLPNADRNFTIKLVFRQDDPKNELLLFSQNENKEYFLVYIYNGIVIVRYDSGRGVEEMSTSNSLLDNQWNALLIKKDFPDFMIELNNEEKNIDVSYINDIGNTLQSSFFLGGFYDFDAVQDLFQNGMEFLNGCIKELYIDYQLFDFRRDAGQKVYARGSSNCRLGCRSKDCLNGGECIEAPGDYNVCLCPPGYNEEKCQSYSPVRVPHFSGVSSYMKLSSVYKSGSNRTDIQLMVRAASRIGTILYAGNSEIGDGDFISLELKEGHIVFKFDLGSGAAVIRSPDPVSANKWYLIRASQIGSMGTLKVAGQTLVTGQAKGSYFILNLPANSFYLGAQLHYDRTSTQRDVWGSFIGCLEKVSTSCKKSQKCN
ncbi:pikachurin-like [Plakobranchus ocellatus]|uniref:Pikachurin-like n=1 Tax=Plakobranchus ocellatus TaxID=259542 RepID=A0AAV4DTT3_9GAST|nr:pikachurin-like [Plakobranchus ocellatus]